MYKEQDKMAHMKMRRGRGRCGREAGGVSGEEARRKGRVFILENYKQTYMQTGAIRREVGAHAQPVTRHLPQTGVSRRI